MSVGVTLRFQLREWGSPLDRTHLTYLNQPLPLLRDPLLCKKVAQKRLAAPVLVLLPRTIPCPEPDSEAPDSRLARPLASRPALLLVSQQRQLRQPQQRFMLSAVRARPARAGRHQGLCSRLRLPPATSR